MLLSRSRRSVSYTHLDVYKRQVKEFIAYLRPMLKEYHEVFTGNVIAQERLKGVGVLSREDAISFGATGGTGPVSYTHLTSGGTIHPLRGAKWTYLSDYHAYHPVSYTHLDVYKRQPLFAKYDKLQKRHMVHPWADFNDLDTHHYGC